MNLYVGNISPPFFKEGKLFYTTSPFSKKFRLTDMEQANEVCYYLYESTCTFLIDLPEGSFRFLKEASHARASGVLHATEGTEGTHEAAESDGKCSVKMHL